MSRNRNLTVAAESDFSRVLIGQLMYRAHKREPKKKRREIVCYAERKTFKDPPENFRLERSEVSQLYSGLCHYIIACALGLIHFESHNTF